MTGKSLGQAKELSDSLNMILLEYIKLTRPAVTFVEELSKFANLTTVFSCDNNANPATINTLAYTDAKVGGTGTPTGPAVKLQETCPTGNAQTVTYFGLGLFSIDADGKVRVDANNKPYRIDSDEHDPYTSADADVVQDQTNQKGAAPLTAMDFIFQTLRAVHSGHGARGSDVEDLKKMWEGMVPRVPDKKNKATLLNQEKLSVMDEKKAKNILTLLCAAQKSQAAMQEPSDNKEELEDLYDTVRKMCTGNAFTRNTEPFTDASIRESLPSLLKKFKRSIDPNKNQNDDEDVDHAQLVEVVGLVAKHLAQLIDAANLRGL